MSVLLGFLGNAWTQLFMWVVAAGVIFYFRDMMKGSGDAWNWMAAGILIYGIRIGYKLLPFYKASTMTEAGRFVLGIIGIIVIFVGLTKYYNNNLKPVFEVAQ